MVPSEHMRYATGCESAVYCVTSRSTRKKTMGTKSTALYAATHSELNSETPAKPDWKP